MVTNIEYGVLFENHAIVAEVRQDLEGLARLGAEIAKPELHNFSQEMAERKKLFRTAENTIRPSARRALREKFKATRISLFRQRAKGRTTQSILSETIQFLLAQGPLRTSELQPLVQRVHPDICDDSMELVNDGVHFGKKWKHHVRNTQQDLKRAGKLKFDGSRWHRAP